MDRKELNQIKLTDAYLRTARLRLKPYRVWDTLQIGLCCRVMPSGAKSFSVAYRHSGRLRWFTLGRYGAIGIAEARAAARQIRAKAALGKDPQGKKMQAREGEQFEKIHQKYLLKASKENKSWRQSGQLINRYVLPTLGKRRIKDLGQNDVWKLFESLQDRPVLANQVLASMSAVFSWAAKPPHQYIVNNPCRGIERNKTTSATRFLSNDEIRQVWPAFDDLGLYQSTALKLILLTGQRPGEVCAMRFEHIKQEKDGHWWTLSGAASEVWPGTKNGKDHEVWLSPLVMELLRELELHTEGYVFPSARGNNSMAIPSSKLIWSRLNIPRFRPHDLRATAATKMDELGLVRQHISLVLNHSESGVTAGYVRHDSRKHKSSALASWSEELGLILQNKGTTDRSAHVIPLEPLKLERSII